MDNNDQNEARIPRGSFATNPPPKRDTLPRVGLVSTNLTSLALALRGITAYISVVYNNWILIYSIYIKNAFT